MLYHFFLVGSSWFWLVLVGLCYIMYVIKFYKIIFNSKVLISNSFDCFLTALIVSDYLFEKITFII